MRIETLKGQGEFDRLFREGRRVGGALFTLVALPGEEGPLRVGFSTPRAFGGAAKRNRARRRLREAIRRRGEAPGGRGGRVVFLVRRGLLGASAREVEEALDRAFAALRAAEGQGARAGGPASR